MERGLHVSLRRYLFSDALDSTALLSCFPKCTLYPLARSGARHKTQVSEEKKMRSRLGLWAAGQLSDLWTAAARLTETEAAIADSRAQSIANDGQAEDCLDALSDDMIDARILQRCRKEPCQKPPWHCAAHRLRRLHQPFWRK